jgi:hypothetical protein
MTPPKVQQLHNSDTNDNEADEITKNSKELL